VVYTDGFKARMIERMAGPGKISATALSREVGVSQASLSQWLRQARTLGIVKTTNSNGNGTVIMTEQAAGGDTPRKRPQDWTAQERLDVVLEAAKLREEELGAFLRRKGLHETQLATWRKAILKALGDDGMKPASRNSPEGKRIRELERDLHRKDKALAEVTALLVLAKKMKALWGDEDAGTPRGSAK
jgi:transposase-like protein